MLDELETGVSGAASDAPVQNPRPSSNDLVEVTFQKNPNQKYKYLEAEPKILGVTQIALTVFFIGFQTAIFREDFEFSFIFPLSLISIIAGGVAIAAEKLHLPTLKACLGVQIVTCVIYGFNLLILSGEPHHHLPELSSNSTCWLYYEHHNKTPEDGSDRGFCTAIMEGYTHIELINKLIVAVQFALSATLAAYCCKVNQCCSPRSHVPVIAIKSPTAPE